MKVSIVGYNLYHLENSKIHKVEAKSIWGLIGNAIKIGLKEFFDKM